MYGWKSFCDRGPDFQHQELANGTLGRMLNELAFEFFKVSEESLGRGETARLIWVIFFAHLS